MGWEAFTVSKEDLEKMSRILAFECLPEKSEYLQERALKYAKNLLQKWELLIRYDWVYESLAHQLISMAIERDEKIHGDSTLP